MNSNNQKLYWVSLLFIGLYILNVFLMVLLCRLNSDYTSDYLIVLTVGGIISWLGILVFLGFILLIRDNSSYDFPYMTILKKTKISLFIFLGIATLSYVLNILGVLTLIYSLVLIGAANWLSAAMFIILNYLILKPFVRKLDKVIEVDDSNLENTSLHITHNPANGVPMIGNIDIYGNSYGNNYYPDNLK